MLKLKVGSCKKLGQANYGSIGAECSVEIEIDQSLLTHDLDGFHAQVKAAFIACNQAINDELHRQQHPATTQTPPPQINGHSHAETNGNGNGHVNRLTSLPSPAPPSAPPPATPPAAAANPSNSTAPRSGKALFAWTKEQEQRYEIGLLKYLNGWAKLQEFPGRMVDWDAAQVSQAHAEATRKILSIQHAGDDAYSEVRVN